MREHHPETTQTLVGAWRWFADRQIWYSSPSIASFLGIHAPAATRGVSSRLFIDSVFDADRSRLLQEMQTCAVTAKPFYAAFRLKRADGSYRLVQSTGHATGAGSEYLGAMFDIGPGDKALSDEPLEQLSAPLLLSIAHWGAAEATRQNDPFLQWLFKMAVCQVEQRSRKRGSTLP